VLLLLLCVQLKPGRITRDQLVAHAFLLLVAGNATGVSSLWRVWGWVGLAQEGELSLSGGGGGGGVPGGTPPGVAAP
jgi:hypothetical protein